MAHELTAFLFKYQAEYIGSKYPVFDAFKTIEAGELQHVI